MMYHQPIISTFIVFSICIYNANSSLLPLGSNSGRGLTFIHKTRGGSTKALDKEAISQLDRQRHQKSADGSIQDDTDISCNNDDDANLKASEQEDIATDRQEDTDTQLYVTKRDGRMEPLDKNKVCFICIDHGTRIQSCAHRLILIFFSYLSRSLLPISLIISTT